MAGFEVDGKIINVSNLEKVLYPAVGFTKVEVINYYIRISSALLPHLKNRPITMKRYPDGVDSEYFYEKQAPKHTPDWVSTVAIQSEGRRANIDYLMLNDLPSLVWSANLANLELHTFLGCAPNTDVPQMIVFDLDPGPPADVIQCAQVAFWIRDLLAAFDLQCFPKTSGSKGMQLYMPLNTPSDYLSTRAFAKALAEHLERQHPDAVVSTMNKQLREGRVFIDWSQNARHKTTVGVYSLRAREKPYVSMPVQWEELEAALKKADPMRLYFLPDQAVQRYEKNGDLFEPLLHTKQRIPENFAEKATQISVKKTRSIGAYRAKRDFTQTSEPAPSVPASTGGELMYVIQKHEATRLHYDFRLEMQGVLRSWAVPKGVPAQRLAKSMAVHVEDHPMEYAKFEGTIPPGNYGAGTVMVWDIGTYTVKETDPVHAYYAGKLHLILKGKKLNGEWVLVKIGKNKSADNKDWLLMKAGEDRKPFTEKEDDSSVLTGRTMKRIARDNDAQWTSGKKAERGMSSQKWKPFASALKKLPEQEPQFVEPMLSKLVRDLPAGEEWLYEVKFDGYRAELIKNAKGVQLLSRNKKDLGRQYPEVVRSGTDISLDDFVLDGEVVALTQEGHPSFQLLQNLSSAPDRPVFYYAFDLLNYERHDLRKLTLAERKRMLESVVKSSDGTILLSSGLEADPEILIEEIRKRGLEGIIAKRKNSTYEAGERSGSWVKYKTEKEQEFVIGGYRPSGKKDDFELLLIGHYVKKKLMYVGKLRAGFTSHSRRQIASQFGKLETKKMPFANLPERGEGRWGEGLTEADLPKYRWLQPKMVCSVRFVEWTDEGHLRHPQFVGDREKGDKRDKRG